MIIIKFTCTKYSIVDYVIIIGDFNTNLNRTHSVVHCVVPNNMCLSTLILI